MYKKIFGIIICMLFIGTSVVANEMSISTNSTIYVPDDYSTIQEAINNSYDGDTIYVKRGYYEESLVIDKSINLIGEYKHGTTIHHNLSEYIINVIVDNVVIKGFRIVPSSGYNYFTSGLYINSSLVTISDNKFTANNFGIFIDYGSNITISENIFYANGYCIFSDSSYEVSIENNTIKAGNRYGIGFDDSYDCIICNNFINNTIEGIKLYDSPHNSFYGNTIVGSTEHGVEIYNYGSQNNIFYINNFINNPTHVTEHYTKEGANYFYKYIFGDFGLGNYYDDYTGTDTDEDGIGDIPYNIPEEGSQDLYPLMKPYNTPPNKPEIDCTLEGSVKSTYEVKFISTDPENNLISLYVDWGDNTTQDWTEYSISGEIILLEHEWEEQGEYNIRAKTKDFFGAESEWATLEISMPKNKAINIPLFLQTFFQRFPLFEKILNQIISLENQ